MSLQDRDFNNYRNAGRGRVVNRNGAGQNKAKEKEFALHAKSAVSTAIICAGVFFAAVILYFIIGKM